jgi:hypothetical protein
MELPNPRGPVSERLVAALCRPPHDLTVAVPAGPAPIVPGGPAPIVSGGPALADEDLQVALYICYELHYRGFRGVDERWEWEPSLLAVRAAMEDRVERALRAVVGPLPAVAPARVGAALTELVDADQGPPLARFLERRATLAQFREFAVHRSVYQLKEADPHTWAIPRLGGRAKAALVEIQVDEYGAGRLDRMHAELFRVTLTGLGLPSGYGHHVDAVPAVTLATSNVISLFGLHRRLRGALLGHLAAYEMTSSVPNRWYGNGLRRLGFDAATTGFYDEHVEADAVHEQIAAHDLCGGFCADEPDQVAAVLFGAASALALDRRFAAHLLGRWEAGRSSLRDAPTEPRLAA